MAVLIHLVLVSLDCDSLVQALGSYLMGELIHVLHVCLLLLVLLCIIVAVYSLVVYVHELLLHLFPLFDHWQKVRQLSL